MKSLLSLTAAVFITVFSISGACAGSILVSSGDYGYGVAGWSNFSAVLDAATGDQVDVAANFENLSQVLGYDAIMLDVRQSTSTLTVTEISNITAFRNTGRRMVLFGENTSWAGWNEQVLSIAGGAANGGYFGAASAVGGNPLTQGVSSIWLSASGLASGGTSLFNQNWATLWGDNILTLLDINFHSDALWGSYDNARFASNVASWAADAMAVPAPAAIWLLGSALAAFIGFRRRFG